MGRLWKPDDYRVCKDIKTMNCRSNIKLCNSVAKAWIESLKEKGYEAPSVTRKSCLKFMILSRSWRRILKHTGLRRFDPVRALEFGCGGGAQLVPLYTNGWISTGIDCSEEVLSRARSYVENVRNSSCRIRGTIEFKCIDFLNYKPDSNLFDLTFQFGVLEHFLDEDERMRYLRKMFDATRPGGFVVSSIPNGGHVMREEQRSKGLGGYNIPEIDYSRKLLTKEMKNCGAILVKVLPHDLFGHLKLKNACGFKKILYKLLYFVLQCPLFYSLPRSFLDKHAYWWIVIAKKPE
jgi:SAM-dependent methyltransferase